MKTCEITRKKAAQSKGKRPDILHRKVAVPELKSQIRLKLSAAGLKVINDAGGMTAYLKSQEETKLSPKLKKLRAQLVAAGKIKEKKPEAEKAEETSEAPVEAAAAEPASEEKSKEKPAEGA